jgi:hypothetical protein
MCEGVDVWITHIGGYPGNTIRHKRDGCKFTKLFICGHSHILKVVFKKHNLLHMNPRLRKKWVSSGSHHAALCD